MTPTTTLPRRLPTVVASALAAAALCLTACTSSTVDGAADADTVVATPAGTAERDDDPAQAVDDTVRSGPGAVGTLDSGVVHELTFEFDEDDYDEMIAAYAATEDKEWIEATVTIDGTTYEQVGIRLKGNSSLRGITTGGGGNTGDASADDPSSLPWLVKLDKYVDGQSHVGLTDLVVRSNTSETALNEAVSLELLELAGLASQDAIGVAFSVNGSDPVYRLVIEHPDDLWMAEWLDADGALYKAESTGDYSYRGDDPDAYDEVFDQEAGDDHADLTPLIEFLQFINEADDEAFVSELTDWLDVDAFATYLAMEELIGNWDDIDGRGNNSYLYYDTETGVFTVVPWDHNLAFGTGPTGGPVDGGIGGPAGGPVDGGIGGPAGGPVDGGIGGPAGGPADDADAADRPAPGDGFPTDRPAGGDLAPPSGAPGGAGGPGGAEPSNVLVERFLADDRFGELYEQRLAELGEELFDSGVAGSVLDAWSALVSSTGLVDDDVVAAETAAIADRL